MNIKFRIKNRYIKKKLPFTIFISLMRQLCIVVVRKVYEVIFKEQIPSETLVLSFFNKLKLKTDVFSGMFQEIMDIFVANH